MKSHLVEKYHCKFHSIITISLKKKIVIVVQPCNIDHRIKKIFIEVLGGKQH